LTAKCVVAAALTVIGPLAPLMLLAVLSVAVIVWLPVVVKVALNVPTPAVSTLFAGSNVAAPWSLLVNATVPPYPGVVLLNWSRAVTVKPMPVPAVAVPAALTTKWVVAAGLTAIGPLTPVMLLVVLSVAVSVWLPAVVNVALNVPIPAISVLLAGSEVEAPWSLLENTTVPL
jgi:hypothetical protein